MEQITFEATSNEMVAQLERTLGKMTVAAEAKLSTGELEATAKKLAGKLKTAAELFGGLSLYKEVTGSEMYRWRLSEELPDNIFMVYANLCKRCNDTAMEVRREDDKYFAEITEGIFTCLDDLPAIAMPTFKVKIEGNTLMAVRSDMLRKLPSEMQKLLGGKETDE